jgi:hypothetical protein
MNVSAPDRTARRGSGELQVRLTSGPRRRSIPRTRCPRRASTNLAGGGIGAGPHRGIPRAPGHPRRSGDPPSSASTGSAPGPRRFPGEDDGDGPTRSDDPRHSTPPGEALRASASTAGGFRASGRAGPGSGSDDRRYPGHRRRVRPRPEARVRGSLDRWRQTPRLSRPGRRRRQGRGFARANHFRLRRSAQPSNGVRIRVRAVAWHDEAQQPELLRSGRTLSEADHDRRIGAQGSMSSLLISPSRSAKRYGTSTGLPGKSPVSRVVTT